MWNLHVTIGTRAVSAAALSAILCAGSFEANAQCQPEWTAGFGVPGVNGTVLASTVFDDGSGPALYIGGRFTSAGGTHVNNIAKWDGDHWSDVGGGVRREFFVSVNALTAFDDGTGSALYVGGSFDSAGNVAARNIARWDGRHWSALGEGIARLSSTAPVAALAGFDDGTARMLYAGGLFFSVGAVSVNHIARWDGSQWLALGEGVDGGTLRAPLVTSLVVFDDGHTTALHVAGQFTTAGTVNARSIAKWNGRSWGTVGDGFSGGEFGLTVADLSVFDDGHGSSLYAGGVFDAAGGTAVANIARWNGSEWSDIGGGTTGPNPAVLALTVFDDGNGSALYAGGRFDTAGNIAAKRVAKWAGQNWSPLASGINAIDEHARVFALAGLDAGRGPALFAGGIFDTAGGHQSQNIARWGCDAGCDPCDMNCDGDINAVDIEPFLDLLFGGGRPCNACTGDTNGDGTIDALDIEPFLNCLFP